MGAYNELLGFFENGLVYEAKKYSYSNSNICILEGDEEKLRAEYPQVYANLISCKHNRDKRTIMEYAQDLVASWIFEDYIIEEFGQQGIILQRTGADRNREILSNIKVSATSDCLFEYKGKSIFIEIMSDYTGYWNKYNRVDFRDNKYNKLRNQKSWFLGISVKDKTFLLFDFGNDINATYSSSHRAYGGKPVYSISLCKEDIKQFNITNVINDLINKFEENLTI